MKIPVKVIEPEFWDANRPRIIVNGYCNHENYTTYENDSRQEYDECDKCSAWRMTNTDMGWQEEFYDFTPEDEWYHVKLTKELVLR